MLKLRNIGGANMHKTALLSLFSFILFFLANQPVQASEEGFIVNEKNRGNWQVNTKPPTNEQIILLYDIVHSKDLVIDTSEVDYKKIGSYYITLYGANGHQEVVKMAVQKNSPIEKLKKPIIQIKFGLQNELTIEKLQQLLENKTNENYTYKIISNGVDASNIGRYPLILEMTDSYGRAKQQQVMVDVLDLEPPNLKIDKKVLTYKIGDQINAEQLRIDSQLGVSDNYSSADKVKLHWHLDYLLYNQAGNYKVGVQAVDEKNNRSAINYITVKITNDYSFKKSLQYEVFNKPTEEEVLREIGARNVQSIALNKVDFTYVSTYQMPIVFEDGVKVMITVAVTDTTAPIITVNAQVVEYRNIQELTQQQIIDDLQLRATDNYTKQLEIKFSKTLDQLRTVGQHQLILSTTDSSGNETQQTIQVNVGEVNAVVDTVENNNPSSDDLNNPLNDTSWIYEEDDGLDGKSEFKEKLLTPTLKTINEQVQLFQPEKKIAATISPTSEQSKINKLWFYLIFLITLCMIATLLIIKVPRKRKRRRINTPSNRRYTKN